MDPDRIKGIPYFAHLVMCAGQLLRPLYFKILDPELRNLNCGFEVEEGKLSWDHCCIDEKLNPHSLNQLIVIHNSNLHTHCSNGCIIVWNKSRQWKNKRHREYGERDKEKIDYKWELQRNFEVFSWVFAINVSFQFWYYTYCENNVIDHSGFSQRTSYHVSLWFHL